MGKAIFKQRSGIYGVAVVSDCGLVTSKQLIGLGQLADKVDSPGSKMTTRQTLVMLVPETNLDTFLAGIEALGLQVGVFGQVVRNVKGCCGNPKFCPRAAGDAFTLGVTLQQNFMNRPVPKDFKISVAGCHRGCTDPYCADFGLVAKGEDDYAVYIGGRGGSKKPRHGRVLLTGIRSSSIPDILEYVLEQYRRLAEPYERLCSTIDRVGLHAFQPPQEIIDTAAEEPDSDFLEFAGLD